MFDNDEHSDVGGVSFHEFTYLAAQSLDFLGVAPPVVTPESIVAESHRILYEKGASVNRMLELHLGPGSWDLALSRQLHAHAWSNPTAEDLLASFESVETGLADRFRPWLMRPGFPLLRVTQSGTTVTITQQPFTDQAWLGGNTCQPGEECLWWIPVLLTTYSTPKGQPSTTTIQLEDATSTLSVPSETSTVELNADYNTFAIATYEPSAWQAIWTRKLSQANLPQEYRLLLSNQIYSLARTGNEELDLLVNYTTDAIALLKNVALAQAGATADVLQQNLFSVASFLQTSGFWASAYLPKVSSVFRPLLDRVGFTGGDSDASSLRTPALTALVVFGDSDTLSEAIKIWKTSGSDNIPADIQASVFYAAVSRYPSAFADLLALYQKTPITSQPLRSNLQFALSGADSASCSAVVSQFKSDATQVDASDALSAISTFLTLNVPCRSIALDALVPITQAALQEDPR